MSEKGNKNLIKCINFLSKVDIPMLKHTARNITKLCKHEDDISPRSVADIVKQDPLMAVKLMRYLQQKKKRVQEHEVMEVQQVLLMLGLETSTQIVSKSPLVEEVLGGKNIGALANMLRVTHRANLASVYAFEWAVRLNDLHFEEVRIAALLHDIAEILMWCFAPTAMLKIKTVQQQNKTLRSSTVQEKVLGFTLHQLQLELALKWKLPKLLITLMDDDHAEQQRVRNVILAVNLARHSANGWDDAALPDDYIEISKLLSIKEEDVRVIVGAEKQKDSQKEEC
ncbi:MAG: HDOD domain-containing protein [Betaproteobacteria bacterium]|nr:HDOD domain-containing protein [Betaproteobacteria bacterium]